MLISHLNLTFRILVVGLYTTYVTLKRFSTVMVLCTLVFCIAHRRDIIQLVFMTRNGFTASYELGL